MITTTTLRKNVEIRASKGREEERRAVQVHGWTAKIKGDDIAASIRSRYDVVRQLLLLLL